LSEDYFPVVLKTLLGFTIRVQLFLISRLTLPSTDEV